MLIEMDDTESLRLMELLASEVALHEYQCRNTKKFHVVFESEYGPWSYYFDKLKDVKKKFVNDFMPRYPRLEETFQLMDITADEYFSTVMEQYIRDHPRDQYAVFGNKDGLIRIMCIDSETLAAMVRIIVPLDCIGLPNDNAESSNSGDIQEDDHGFF